MSTKAGALRTIPSYRERVTIMPLSGVQFVEFGFNAATIDGLRFTFWEEEIRRQSDQLAKLHEVGPDESGDGFVTRDGQYRVDPDETYQIKGSAALDTFNRVWLPLPVFRIHDWPRDRPIVYQNGPTTWARIYITRLEAPDEQGHTHRAVVALDTAVDQGVSEDPGGAEPPYLAPTRRDCEARKEFRIVDDPGRIAFFINLPWVDEWLDDSFFESRKRAAQAAGKTLRQPSADERQRRCEHWATYIAFLGALRDAIDVPVFQLADVAAEHALEPPVLVDLVLDVGNSRTCGVLIEQYGAQEPPNLDNSYVLELRDLSRPERVYNEPFESRVEFAKADFGNEQFAARAGRPDAFVWYSLVRTGPEAAALCTHAKSGVGATGLSSPKRYLWDNEPFDQLWRHNMALHRSPDLDPPVDSPIMQFVSESGTVLSLPRKGSKDPGTAAFLPRFSRSSLFTFLLQEILLQAYTQMNSVANRMQRRYSDRPRRLHRLVMTLPPGMPLAERRLFKQRAEGAVQLLWDCLSAHDPVNFSLPKPIVAEPYDEASATQVVFLYSEVTRLLKGAEDLVAAYGIPPDKPGAPASLRIASIDIGGGTTDLMVTTYEIRDGRQIIPQQNFRESFRLAGDDLLREIVRNHVLEGIRRGLRTAGLSSPDVLTGRLFGADGPGIAEPERQLRRQFALELAVPIGLQILAECETQRGFGATDRPQRPIRDFFTLDSMPSREVVAYVEKEASRLGARGFNLLDTPIEMDLVAAANTTSAIFDPVLRDLSEVVNDLDCDLLLLSGRPSRLPVVRELLLSHLPLSPDRIVSMSDYKVGSWYPFRDHAGLIDDPKTTTAVGAMLTWLALGRLPNFRFEASQLKHKSTARFIGPLEESRILTNSKVALDVDLDNPNAGAKREATIPMYAPFMLGYRQLPLERWPTMPLYWFEFADYQKVEADGLPWQVKIGPRKDDADVEDFDVLEVEPRKGANINRSPQKTSVRIRLQTLPSQSGYWLDTGILEA